MGGEQFEPISGGVSSMTRLCELDSVVMPGGKDNVMQGKVRRRSRGLGQ